MRQQMAKFTYYEGEDKTGGNTYGSGHSTQMLYVKNLDTGEERAYDDWTYMDVSYWDEDSEEDVSDEDMQIACEELQETLQAIWDEDEGMGYGEMPYTVVSK